MSMPSVFVSHGSPTLILENLPARDFLSTLGSLLPRPKAIVAVSAHWNTERPAVSTAERPETIHDFYGFPDDLYRLHYEAPGAPELAERVAKMTGAVCDPSYGLDHGAWVPAMLGWPEADIPIFQLAVQPYMTPAHHIALGRKLAPLREEGILVMGSGSATHNLRRLMRGQHERQARAVGQGIRRLGGGDGREGRRAGAGELPHRGAARARRPSDRRALPAAARRLRRRPARAPRASRCTAASPRPTCRWPRIRSHRTAIRLESS